VSDTAFRKLGKGLPKKAVRVEIRHAGAHKGILEDFPDRAVAVGAVKGRIRRIAIVALARKLLVALWRYLETGLVPRGAKADEQNSNTDSRSL
jgi:hypothetical protein